MIKRCIHGCKHGYQDEKYGFGMRLMTVGGSTASPKYTCTVCGKENKPEIKGKK